MESAYIFARAVDNNAPETHPSSAQRAMSDHGSNANWAVFALHVVLLLAILGWTMVTPLRRRVFNYFSIGILLIASIYYFVLASNLGSTVIPTRYNRDTGLTRQIFYARWVGYTLNFTLVFWALQLLAGVGWGSILFTILLVWSYTINHLIGALVWSQYKWGFFAFGVLSYLLLVWKVLIVGRGFAVRLWQNISGTFTMLAAYELFLLLLYPIAWGVSEAGNQIHSNSEQAFYCVLDTLSQGVFAVLLVVMTRKVDHDVIGLSFHDHGRHRPTMRDKVRDSTVTA